MPLITYPPAFDPDRLIAENKGLRDIDVFLEGDGNNPMFFYVRGVDKVFTYGKHYFTLAFKSNTDKNTQMYSLRHGTDILFEVHDAAGTLILSQITTINYENGVAIGYISIEEDPGHTYKSIVDGTGALTIVGELDGVPDNWKDVYNYRCIFPFQIIKNYQYANSPVMLSSSHKLQTLNGKFSFAISNISIKGGGDYDGSGKFHNPPIATAQ